MMATDFNDLAAFALVARERSFTRAAAQLGVSQSALSQTVRGLEARIGLRLLARTTRSVSPTEAGDRLLQTLVPRLEDIEMELAQLVELRDTPSGLIRLTASERPAITVIAPALARLLPLYPDIRVEVVVDYGLKDIVAERFDAGVRLGEQVAKDMISVRAGPDLRMAVVAAPSYFERHAPPKKPQDLVDHRCINLRLPARNELLAWEFAKKKGREVKVQVNGPLVFNNRALRLHAALAGLGLTYMPEDDEIAGHLAAGRLVRVLDDWCQPFPGYHLFYPSRKHPSQAFQLLVEAIRYPPR